MRWFVFLGGCVFLLVFFWSLCFWFVFLFVFHLVCVFLVSVFKGRFVFFFGRVVFWDFFAEFHVYGGNILLVTTGDVLSFAIVYPDSFQLSPRV